MQGYVTLDTRDLPRAVKFYEPIARELGVRRAVETRDGVAWGLPGSPASISVEASRGGVASCGTVALQAADPEQVQRLYELAIAQGGCGEAAPCERGGYFAACFRDPDGNRLNAFCMTQH
jgi:catechol 2,3-dioxygenase-like lactoylglutathione lyase family enzyme